MPTLNVELGERSYPILIECGLLRRIGEELSRMGFKGRVAVITNPKVKSLYAEALVDSLECAGLSPFLVEVPDGEEYKNLREIAKIYDRLLSESLERTAPVIALGGGVIGDMAGFVAATYLRGVPFIQVPTTLLAEVDSSVGGKTGVNHEKGKNLIGAFYQPKAVFIDPLVLKTLDERDFKSGLSEVIKYGIIRDAEFFEFLEANVSKILLDGPSSNFPSSELISAIRRSCELKAEVVAADERECGQRAILNLGHTFGHAIEALTGYTELRHGEAVAIGMVMAAELSEKLGHCSLVVVERIKGIVNSFGLESFPPKLSPDKFIQAMRGDKKVIDGRIRFVLIKDLGDVFIEAVSEETLLEFLDK
jgi:3-dehydroquinate synthase